MCRDSVDSLRDVKGMEFTTLPLDIAKYREIFAESPLGFLQVSFWRDAPNSWSKHSWVSDYKLHFGEEEKTPK